MPPPIWKNPIDDSLRFAPIPVNQLHHVFDAGADGVDVANVAGDATRSINISERGILPAGNEHRQILVRRRHHPTVGRIDLVKFFEVAFTQNLEKKFVWKFSLLIFRGPNPFIDHDPFDPTHRFLFRNASVGYAIEMAIEKLFFLLRTELAIVWEPLVMTAGNEIEEVFLQIRAGAGDGVDFVVSNHFRQRNTELGRAHRAGEGDHHFAATIEMRDVSIGGILDHRGVEVPVMPINEFADRARFTR